MLKIRPEDSKDIHQIRDIVEQAFGQPVEANLVDRLRAECPEQISLVASMDNQLVGHALFTPAVIENEDRSQIKGFGLAPVSVLPAFQNQGVGSALIRSGLQTLQKANQGFVIVLGHPDYYRRFGFEPATDYQITCKFAGDHPEAFMIHLLENKGFKSKPGIARYHAAFESV